METTGRRSPPLPLVLLALLFFGSGLSALIYELIWLRRLQLTFGSTTTSVTTVLAAFMAGLGLGSYLIGRFVDRSRLGGVRAYAFLELGIGFYGLFSLPLLSLTEALFALVQTWLQLDPEWASLLKLLLAFPVLALPAGLMGGTLPALVRGLVYEQRWLGERLGLLYGLNTAGAAVGAGLTGLVLIEVAGLWRTIALAVTINLLIGFFVLIKLRGLHDPMSDEEPVYEPPPEPVDRELKLRRHLRSGPVLFCAASVVLTGGLSMLYEVAWTRVISLVVGSSTYAFTLVLTIFLVGLALGSLLFGYLYTPGRWQLSVRSLGLVLFLLGGWAALSLVAIPNLPWVMLWLVQMPGTSFARVLVAEGLLALFVLLVPALLFGAALPMAMTLIARAVGQLGRDIGGAYLANTLGAIVGSVVTGFLLIPLFGTRATLLVGLCLNLGLAGAAALAFSSTLRRRIAGVVLAVGLGAVSFSQPEWPASLFDAGLHYQHRIDPARTPLEARMRLARYPSKLLFFEEGVNATITVRRTNDAVTLFVNGKPDASSLEDMPHQVLLGILPAMAHPSPRRVGLVGWGSGVTAHALTLFPEIQQIDVAEIESAVVRASPTFRLVNEGVETDRRLRFIFDDARSFFRTSEARYDLLVSQPSNPWMAGVSNLFSLDFYEQAKDRLNPGGVFAQWVQLYYLDSESVALIMRTLLHAFREVQVWFSDGGDLVLLASDTPIRIAHQRLTRAYQADGRVATLMSRYGPGPNPENLFGCFLLGTEELKQVLARLPGPLMTDDRPLLEYQAVRNLYRRSHAHIEQLWQAKMDLGRLVPPVPPGEQVAPGAVLEGSIRVLRNLPELRGTVVRWAMKQAPDVLALKLAQARVYKDQGRLDGALKILNELNKFQEMSEDVQFLRIEILLEMGKPHLVNELLTKIGDARPVSRSWYAMQANMGLGRYHEALRNASDLMDWLHRTRDPESHMLPWNRFYQHLGTLMKATSNYRVAVRLLGSDKPVHGGELFRLLSLVDAHSGAGQHREAAQVMEQLMDYGVFFGEQLRTCERVFARVGQTDRAAQCRQQRHDLGLVPVDRPLWQTPTTPAKPATPRTLNSASKGP